MYNKNWKKKHIFSINLTIKKNPDLIIVKFIFVHDLQIYQYKKIISKMSIY